MRVVVTRIGYDFTNVSESNFNFSGTMISQYLTLEPEFDLHWQTTNCVRDDVTKTSD
jgi:hypothetical protein